MKKVNYFDMEEFSGLYLEDSFVLQIIETIELISFQMEFALTKDHPDYHQPLMNEINCYRYGAINFIEPIKVKWERRKEVSISIDSSLEIDFGNIDLFYELNGDYFLEGDWGKVVIRCKNLKIVLQ